MSIQNIVIVPILAVTLGSSASAAVQPMEKPSMAVRVEAGKYTVLGKRVTVPQSTVLQIDPPEKIRVQSEEIVLIDQKPTMYIGGTVLRKTFGPIDGTRLPYAIAPESVRIHSAADGGTVYEENKDYFLDHMWGGVCRLETASVAKDAKVYADYEVYLQRIDAVQVDKDGKVSVKKGASGQINVEAPAADKGCRVIANIFVPFRTAEITQASIYPLPARSVSWKSFVKVSGHEHLSNTLSLLDAGKHVNVVCWGDSVTSGGSPTSHDKCYVELFRTRLKAAFPKADINLINAGIGGSSTESRRDGFDKEVLAYNPDLITVEFVNDCGLSPEKIRSNWAEFIARARAHNPKVEFILITPHYMRPDWMGNFEKAVAAMRQASVDNNVALADTTNIWANLRSIGLPYETLLANEINHPNNLGHEFFSESLMSVLGKD